MRVLLIDNQPHKRICRLIPPLVGWRFPRRMTRWRDPVPTRASSDTC